MERDFSLRREGRLDRVACRLRAPLASEERANDAVIGGGCKGLSAALEARVRLFEGTRIVEISDGSRVTVRSQDGEVSAEFAALAIYAWGSELAMAYEPAAFRSIEIAFRERRPELREVKIARFWSGWVAFTTDFNPVFGVEGNRGNLLYGLG